MIASKIIGTASGLLFAVGLGVALWAIHDRNSADQALSQWSAKDASMREGVERAKAAVVRAEKDAQAARAAASRKAASNSASGAMRSTRGGPPDWSAILAKHPELQAAFEQAYAANKAQEYSTLYAKLHLTQEQIDKLDLLMAKDLENLFDLQGTARAQGLSMIDPAIAQVRKQQQADLASQEQQVLGPDDYSAFQTFDNEAPLRGAVKDAASFAIAQGGTFTAAQEEQVTELLAQSSPSFLQDPSKRLDPSSVNWDAALAQAQGFLSPAQISALHAEQQFTAFWPLLNQFYSQRSAAAK